MKYFVSIAGQMFGIDFKDADCLEYIDDMMRDWNITKTPLYFEDGIGSYVEIEAFYCPFQVAR